MKHLFIFPCIFLYSLASEFIAEDFEQGPSIAIRLSKRLDRSKKGQQDLVQNSINNDQSETQLPSKQVDDVRENLKTPDRDNSGTLSVSGSQDGHGVCYYNVNTSVIIKTNSSLTAGAKFMKYAQAESSVDCAKKCCDTTGCNEAIFENKKDYSCYLFDCGTPNVCVFAPHNSYISMNFQQENHKMDTSHAHLAIKHESELAGLDNQGPPKDSIVESTTVTTTTSHTTFQPTTLKKRTKIVSLDDVCTPADKCEDRHAECIEEKCRCQEGYIIKYGICRRQCDKKHFECDKRGSESIGVDCIELEYVCDGVPQCGDGSDEFGCSPDAFKDGNQNEIPYQVDVNPKKIPTDKFRKLKVKPVNPSVSHHDESSNKQLKQEGQLPVAKYNTETMIKKDKPKQALQNSKEFATSEPPVVHRGHGQQFSNHNTNTNQGWVKNDGSKDLIQGSGGNSKKPSLNEAVIQPSSRETNRHRAKSAASNRIWNQNQLSQYKKHQEVNPQLVGNRGYISNYQNQHRQMGINQVDNQGFVGSGHKQSGLIAEENQKFGINQPKPYNRINSDSVIGGVVSGSNPNQVQLPQRSRQLYQTANQNYMDSQYISDNSQLPQKQNSYGYSGNNYGYQQKVAAAYNNGYPVLQPQNSGINQDSVNYVQNTAQAYNWGDYPSDYMYTDQNSDYSNMAANTAQGYQYAPDNGRINQGLHNGNRPSDNIKQIHPTGAQIHYQATENKITGDQQQQQPTQSKNMLPDVPVAQDHPTAGFHTESKMQAANTNTDYKAEIGGNIHSNAASTLRDGKDKVNDEGENDSAEASSKESTTVRSTTYHQNGSVTHKPPNNVAKFFEHSNYILKKKVVVTSPTDSAQGPIVALALGLSFTTMLLIFVGCRLHRVKRRLRKGRALHSNEADYLINGMYL